MMTNKKLMSDVLLEAGDNLVLLFPTRNAGAVGGETPPAGRAFFFKVLAWGNLKQVYSDIMTAETATYLATETGVDYGYLGTTGLDSGKDLLRIKDDPWWIYHFGYSPLQSTLRVYPRLEIGHNISGWEYKIKDEPDPTAGDDFGYSVRGSEVLDYEDPPALTETIAFRSKEEGRLWQFGFYNESDELRIYPIIYLKGKAYRVIPIVNRATMEKMITASIPRHLVTIGGLDKYTEETIIPSEWKAVGNEMEVTFEEVTGVFPRGRRVTQVPMSEETAARLGGFMRRGETVSETLERLMSGREASR